MTFALLCCSLSDGRSAGIQLLAVSDDALISQPDEHLLAPVDLLQLFPMLNR